MVGVEFYNIRNNYIWQIVFIEYFCQKSVEDDIAVGTSQPVMNPTVMSCKENITTTTMISGDSVFTHIMSYTYSKYSRQKPPAGTAMYME